MNRERAKKLAPIIEAFGEGKRIQFKYSDENTGWQDLPEYEVLIMTFPAEGYDYRIKPEPEVIYVNRKLNGNNFTYTNKIAATAHTWNEDYEYIAKKFIEVTE